MDPLGQDLALMDELAAKVAREGVVKQAAYEEYFAVGDDENKNNQFAIRAAATQKEKWEAKGGELSASTNIISIATAELEKATEIREKETADLVASEKELVATVETVARAIKIMEKEMNTNPASFARVASKGLESVMNSLKDGVVEQAAYEEHFAVGDDVNKRIADSPSRLPPLRRRMGGRMR